MVQWVRTCLPGQGTQVRSLIGEDPTCRGAAESMYTSTEPCSKAGDTQQARPLAATAEARASRGVCPAARETAAVRSPTTTVRRRPRSPQLKPRHCVKGPVRPETHLKRDTLRVSFPVAPSLKTGLSENKGHRRVIVSPPGACISRVGEARKMEDKPLKKEGWEGNQTGPGRNGQRRIFLLCYDL